MSVYIPNKGREAGYRVLTVHLKDGSLWRGILGPNQKLFKAKRMLDDGHSRRAATRIRRLLRLEWTRNPILMDSLHSDYRMRSEPKEATNGNTAET